MAISNNYSYVVNDGGASSSYDTIPNLQVSFVGSPSAIDVSNSNWKSSSKSSFNGEGIDNLQLKVTTGAICIRQIKIYIDGLLFRTLEAYGGTIFWATTNVMALEASDVSMHPAYWSSVANISLTNDDTKVYGGNPYAGMKITQRSSISFTSSGYKTIKAEIKYYPGNWDSTSNPPESQMVTKTLYLGSLEVKNPVISELSLSGYTNSFWVNQTFSKGNLSVKAIYKYQVANTEAHTDSVSGYSISSPDMSTYGTKRITVTYSSKTAYYDIYVYGIQSFTKPVLKSYFKLNEALTTLQSTVTFTNGQTTTVAVVISFDTSTIGTKTVNYSIYVSTTKETKTWTSTASVFGIASISINTDNVTKRFDYDDTFSYSGLVVTASYGLAGSVTISSGYGVEVLDWSVGTNKTVAVSYAGFIKTYSINIDGLYAVDFNIENCALYDNGHFRINKGGTFISGGKTCSVRRYSNGTLGTSTTWSGSVSSSVVDTSSIGTKQVTFSITEDGVTLSQSFDVVVFDYNELVVTNAPKKFFIKDGVLPTLSIGGMSVVAKTSDAKEQVLTLGALNNGYRLNPEVGTTLTSNRKVRVLTDVGLTAEFEIQIEENHPVDGATISVEGTLEKRIYSKGEQIDITGLTVKVSEMAGGETDYEVDFTAVIDGKDNLIFDDNDDIGLYDLVISVDGIEDSVILEDAVVLDGISSLSNVISNKVYKSGEKFDITQVSGTVNLVSGLTRPISVNDISPINQDVHYGNSTITLVICGISTTVNISVIKVLSLTITPKTPTWLNYSFGQAFDRTRFTAKVKYSDNTTEKTVDVNSLTFAFTESSTIVGETLSEEHLLPTDLDSDGIDAKLSFTEDGYTVESPFHILVKAIVSAKLYDQDGDAVNKVAFEYGQALNIDENVIKITYNDETTSYDVIDADTIISDGNNGNINRALVKTSTPISAHIVATCGTQRALASFTIHCHYLSALNVDFDDIEDEDMFIYDTLDVSNVTAERVISSTDEDDDLYPQTLDVTENITFTFNGQNIGLNNYKFPSVGTFELVANYSYNGQNASDSTNVSVANVELQSITLSTSAAFKPLNSYVDGENLALTGLTISLHYNRTASDHTLEFNNPNVYLVDEDDNPVSKTELLDILDNNKELFIKYTESNITKVASLGTLTVIAKSLTGIELVSNPSVTSFTYGDVFNVTGAVVKASFNNGTSEYIQLNDPDLSITGITIGHVLNPDEDTLGNKTITFSYTYLEDTETTTITVSVVAPKIARLTTNVNDPLQPVQLQFKDQAVFSMSGLVVTAVMENGWSVALDTFVHDANTVLNIDGSGKIQVTGNYGFKTITLSGTNPYDNTDTKTITYQVEIISSGDIISALLQLEGDYNHYLVGDTFNAKGVSFAVTDIDGNTWNATNIVCEPAIGTLLRSARKITVKATYTNGSFTKTETFDIVVNVANSIDFIDENNYQLAIGDSNGDLFEEITHEEATIKFGKVLDDNGNVIGEFYPLFHEDKISIDDNPLHPDTVGFNVYTGNDAEHDCIGYIDLGVGEIRNAHVILFNDPVNPIEGQSNIEVTFPHFVNGASDKINKCLFGIVYNNRLFVSGNADYKNMDWHSSETNNEINEFTYFSDLDYCKYGSDHIPVVGYDIYRDGDLLAVKAGSRNEATLYRRETKLVSATDYSGQTVGDGNLAEEQYPCFPINSNGGEGGLSHRSIVNFVGETLILTRSGLKAITSKNEIYNSAKYTFNVSSFINAKITYEELENAHLFSFKEMLFLKTNRGVYVGYYGLRNDDNEYEWYFLDNIDADIFFEVDDELYFANNKGEISRFDKEIVEYADKHRTFIGTGGTTLDIDELGNRVLVSGRYEENIKEGNSFHLITTYNVMGAERSSLVYASLGEFVNKNTRENSLDNPLFDQTLYVGLINDDNTIEIKPYTSQGEVDDVRQATIKNKFYEGREIYLDKFVGNGIQAYTETMYRLVKVDKNNELDLRYKLVDEFDNEADLSGIDSVRMSFIVNSLAITRITNVSDYGTGGKQFQLLGDHDEILDLIYYNNRTENNYKGVITVNKTISAYYVTAPFTMGSIVSYKTIWQWVIANDTNLASYMDVGYFSSHKQGDYDLTIKSASGSKELNFSGFNFDKVQFTSDRLPHIYSKNKVLARVGFIRFLFRNNEASNMVLTTLQLVYTLSQFTKGER